MLLFAVFFLGVWYLENHGPIEIFSVSLGVSRSRRSGHPILSPILGIAAFLTAIGALIHGFNVLIRGSRAERNLYKDDIIKNKFEKELLANDVIVLRQIIFLKSWLIIKYGVRTHIIEYKNIKKYYKHIQKTRGEARQWIAIEANRRYFAPYSERKDGDIEDIFKILEEKIKNTDNQLEV